MQALLIFLAAALLLVVIGLYFPTRTHKTPQNDRDVRQGDTARWIQEINSTGKR